MTGALHPPINESAPPENSPQDGHDSFPNPGFFEGAEKLLEITFKNDSVANQECDDENGNGGLRNVQRTVWDNLLRLVNCEIVSSLSNDCLDSYVLSESSMFVYARKFVLKTCGTTTLLYAVEPFLKIAQSVGLFEVENVFYSRKCFIEPERQKQPHGQFKLETKALQKLFANGSSCIVGRMDGDHWYLFTAGEINRFPRYTEFCNITPDTTLEILMHDLDPRAMRHFYRTESFVSTRHSSKMSGILDLVPEASLDDLVFNPCGYSANGILDDSYFTIHVTPQPECSFASFETNIPLESYTNLINKVLKVFCPRRCTVTLFTNETAICGTSSQGFERKKIHGFSQTHSSTYDFGSYNLTFVHLISDRPALS